MVAMTPALFMVVVRSAFRLGRSLYDIRDERIRAAAIVVAQLPVGAFDLERAALECVWRRRELRTRHPRVFDLADRNYAECQPVDLNAKRVAIEEGLALLEPEGAPPDWAREIGVRGVVTIHSLLGTEGKRRQWGRFGLLLAKVGIEAVAAQPDIVGVRGRAETLLGAFASKVDTIIGPDIDVGEVDGHSFRERAAAVLLEASLSTIAENPSTIVSAPHWAEFVGNVLTPLSQAQHDAQGELLALSRLPQLMRGPMAQAALRTLADHQAEFLGARFAADRAAGAVTQEILAAAVRARPEDFNIMNAFSQRGLTLVYTSALDAAAKRPELFIHGDGRSVESWRELLGSVAGIMRDAPPPFDLKSGLGDRLACAVIDIAANHLTRAVLADTAGEGAWRAASGQILKSILEGFKAGLIASAHAASGARINPFESVFNQEQAIEIVRIIAAQAAKTPEMLLGNDHRNEVYLIAQAVATFMAAPETRLASPEDWRCVIAVALYEAANNPGALFQIDPSAPPESHLATTLIGMMMQHAAQGLRQSPAPGVGATTRRRGSVLFGSTLREAISMTLRAAANNARALLDDQAHMQALSRFVGHLQSYTEEQNGRIGAAEWLWLYRCFIAEVIERGAEAEITPERLERALRSAGSQPALAPTSDTLEETPS